VPASQAEAPLTSQSVQTVIVAAVVCILLYLLGMLCQTFLLMKEDLEPIRLRSAVRDSKEEKHTSLVCITTGVGLNWFLSVRLIGPNGQEE